MTGFHLGHLISTFISSPKLMATHGYTLCGGSQWNMYTDARLRCQSVIVLAGQPNGLVS
jgi:hypothetical protein